MSKNGKDAQKQLNPHEIEGLRSKLKGQLLLPEDEGYDEARAIWNAMINRKPSLIIQCENTQDVVEGVNFARNHHLLLAIKGGGHNVAGKAVCEGGLMLDLSLMRNVEVNPEKQTVRVEAGCLLSDIDKETQEHGLAVSGGIVSHTGVSGLTLGGGFGWISRKHGLSIDNLLAAEVVTADGQIITASGKENPDLFWGLRGGGGNFGVVTSFEFQCAEVGPEVFSGLIIQRFEDAKAYMQFHAEYVRTLPDDMTVWMVVRPAPPLPFLDPGVHGKLVIVVPFVYLGDQEKGEKLIQPIREFGKPHGEALGMNPWIAWQAGFDGLNSHGARNYWKSHHLKDLSSACIDKVIEFVKNIPGPNCEVFIPHMEGAPARVSEDETAYAFRKTPFVLNIHTRWENPAEDQNYIGWASEFFNQTKSFANGVYVNFLSDEGEERVKQAYTTKAWERLVALKNKYDPTNLFRMNQNIRPTA
ncbi:MAG: FAD-binding oxidoreductase [Calditrichaeota bacterium]|nr:MAG: FAD-binding oxidoreductase [Calditrichota bacterium]